MQAYQLFVTEAILEQRVPNGTGAPEDDVSGEPNLEAAHVEPVDGEFETEKNVVDNGDSH